MTVDLGAFLTFMAVGLAATWFVFRIGATVNYDEHPTDPRHGGKMTAEQMADRIDELETALHEIDQWSRAYPEDIFVPPTSEDCRKAHKALKDIGFTLDKFSGHAMRHAIWGVGKVARQVLGVTET